MQKIDLLIYTNMSLSENINNKNFDNIIIKKELDKLLSDENKIKSINLGDIINEVISKKREIMSSIMKKLGLKSANPGSIRYNDII